ncbi:hypothetical protein [Aromatoleum sp.]|uniref:hypothetical protein n=1 Tax=Aromatoleum sp. TaxID=2307007 RepID=UPI002FC728EE
MDLFGNRGVPLQKQLFTWKDLVGKPISKLDDEAFTRVRVILMNSLELDALRLSHLAARMNGELRRPLAEIRRAEQHQATTVNWLLSADHSPLETTIAYEQVAVEVTAEVAQREPDAYLAQVYRFGLLEDVDHLYRYSALLDRLEGKDSNNILQGHTDIVPGRPTADGHRAPIDDVRRPCDANAPLASKLFATLITAAEYQTHDYYMTIGPTFADPIARQLYAEIASIEEQHVTQYASLLNPRLSFLELMLLHEATEVYGYYSCAQSESNPRLRALWEQFCDYELGHLHVVGDLIRKYERRDPAEVLDGALPAPLEFKSQRDFVRDVFEAEVNLRANGYDFVPRERESDATLAYRYHVNADGSPSTQVAAAYHWTSGTELNRSIRRAA